MALILAPMEGLLDFVLRDILTRVGGIDRCVSEFIRVTNTVLPERVFLRIIPELANGGRTLSGVPVRGQLLGSDPQCLAENAARLAAMGTNGIDLNFGCPAKLVNRHGGGAALLDQPELLLEIVTAVRRAVPKHLPVSAKMRLGFADDTRAEECALALQQGGACEIVVHARTKADAYRPPAYWHRVADIARVVNIPLIANGEIWTREDALKCQVDSGCKDLMLGRGMVANPGLALEVLGRQRGLMSWEALQPLVYEFWCLVVAQLEPRQHAGRLKQWLNFLRRVYPEAQTAYEEVRTLVDKGEVDLWFGGSRLR